MVDGVGSDKGSGRLEMPVVADCPGLCPHIPDVNDSVAPEPIQSLGLPQNPEQAVSTYSQASPGLVEEKLVKTALILSTVNHPYYKNGKNLDPGPGSQVWDADWFSTFRDALGVNTYALFGTALDPKEYPREDGKKVVLFETKDRDAGLPFKLPLFTMGLTFDKLTIEEVRQYVKTMMASALQFIGDIEKTTGQLTLIHSSHLFLNALFAGEINRRRYASGLPFIPTVATAHGTALKFFMREKWFEALEEPEIFGNPSKAQPNNIAIGSKAYTELKEKYGNTLEIKSDYAEKMGMSAFEFLAELQSPTLIGFRRWIAPYIYRGVGAIVAISEANRDRVMTVFPDFPTDHIYMIYNGYVGSIFKPMPELERKTVLAGLKTSNGEPLPQQVVEADYLVAMTGKFVGWKGVDKLIMAAAGKNPSAVQGKKLFTGYESYFAQSGKTVATIIMGTNKDDPELVELYEALPGMLGAKNVVFLGHVHPEVMARVANVSDVGVFPSKDEPFGMTAMETMACGTPVLVGTGGFRNFVDESKGGYVDHHRPENIADQVITAITQDWKAVKGPVALGYAADYTWEKQFAKYIPIYEQVADWVIGKGHPRDVHHPRRLTNMKGVSYPLRQVQWSPYKVAMEIVKLIPEAYAGEAAKAATFVKCALRHGWETGKGRAEIAIKAGEQARIMEKINAGIKSAKK